MNIVTFNNIPKSKWKYTYLIARTHSLMWPITTLYLWAFVMLLTYAIITPLRYKFGAICFSASFTFLSILINFIGIHAVWLCQKFGIDYNKKWTDV